MKRLDFTFEEVFGITPGGNEKLPLFNSLAGEALRDSALARSREGRHHQIQQVREWLVKVYQRCGYLYDHATADTLTADDVLDAVEALGLGGGDRRWVANVLRGWSEVRVTPDHIPSRRPECHARLKRVWRWA